MPESTLLISLAFTATPFIISSIYSSTHLLLNPKRNLPAHVAYFTAMAARGNPTDALNPYVVFHSVHAQRFATASRTLAYFYPHTTSSTLFPLALSNPLISTASHQINSDVDQHPPTTALEFQPSPSGLTTCMLAMHDRTFDRLLHAAQAIIKAIDVQKAAKDLAIDLPLHCYMSDRHELARWVQQQSK
jgi:hypothetical protein